MNHAVPGWRSRASAIMSCNARRWGTEERFMRVLVSNDDGVDAPGIQALARGLRAAGHEVLIVAPDRDRSGRSEEHTSELQSLMRISYAVFCLKKKNKKTQTCNCLPYTHT